MATGVFLDIDGVLTVSWKALPGAVETLAWLQDRGIQFRLVTNTSSKTRQQIASLLASVGMAVDLGLILTAVSSAGRYLAEHYPDAGCLVVNQGDLSADLEGVAVADRKSARVVLLGAAGPSVGYTELDAVFKLAVAGVPVVALHPNARYQTSDGPALDMGAFIVGLEAAAGIEVTVVGKPAPEFFDSVMADAGVDPTEAMMVGDDIGSDVLGAQAAGMTGVLVKTGKFRPSDLGGDSGEPDHIIDSIAELPDLLETI